MLRKDMDYNDRFRMVVKEFGRKIVIELNRAKAVVSDDEKTVTIIYNDSKTRQSSRRLKARPAVSSNVVAFPTKRSRQPVVEKKTKKGLNTTDVTPDQFKLVQDIIKLCKRTSILRKDVKAAHLELTGKNSHLRFILRNRACKTETHGLYDLSVLKVASVGKQKSAFSFGAAPNKIAK